MSSLTVMNWPETVLMISSRIVPTVVSRKNESPLRQARRQQRQVVAQFGGRRSDGDVYVLGGEPVHRQRVDDTQRHRPELLRRQRPRHPGAEHLCLVEHLADLGDRPVRRVVLELRPVGVVADQPRRVVGHVAVEQGAHLAGQRCQHLRFSTSVTCSKMRR